MMNSGQKPHGLKSAWLWIVALLAVWIFNFGAVPFIDPYYFTIIMYAGINIVLAVSLNLINGYTGQFSMGHAGFMAIGAYTSAVLTSWARVELGGSPGFEESWISVPVFIGSLLVGGGFAGLIGYAVGLPSLRLKGDYLAIVTLGFGEIIRVVLLNMDFVGGARGMPNIPALSSFGWVYTGVLVTAFIIWRLMTSRYGRAFLAVREDEVAAEAMGVHTTRAKVRAFMIGAFFAGIAGGLFGHYLRYLNPAIFDFNRSFEIIIMVVLGGMGSITGAVVAAVLLTAMKEALRPLQELTQVDFRMVIYSLFLIVLMLKRPNGLFGRKEFFDYLPDWLRKKLHMREKVEV